MQLIHLPEKTKEEIELLVKALKATIADYIEEKDYKVHPAVAYLAVDILRNEMAKKVVTFIENETTNANETPSMPSFQVGVA